MPRPSPQFYKRTAEGTSPVSKEEAKTFLRLDTDDDDAFVALLLKAVANAGEKFTGRDFRDNTYEVKVDAFAARICLARSPIASLSSIKYQDDSTQAGVEQTVPNTDYYLRKSFTFSEVLLEPDGDPYPSDVNAREASITIEFKTEAKPEYQAEAKVGMLRHLAYLYENRGDADPDSEDSIVSSGAAEMYELFQIANV
jgi:uncharacterized phiE125 gp8 family phage protein